VLPSGTLDSSCATFLDSEYCAIDNEDFFVRGIIELPVIGAAENFCWGVWGSLSRDNFEALIRAGESKVQPEKMKMFSWLSTQIAGYPDTLSLEMITVIQEPGTRPQFQLERSDHPLALEFYGGITPERVKEITLRNLPPQPEK
jgi:hypothetical protein